MSEAETGAAVAAADTAAIAPAQTAVEKPNTMDALTATMSDAYDKINPPRSDGGQYAPKDKPAEAAGADTGDAPKPVEDQAQTQTQEPAKPAIQPPVSWSAEKKAAWANLSPDVQEYIAQRESEAHKRISELGQTAKAFEAHSGVLEQYRDVLNYNGGQPTENLSRALNAARWFTSNPRAATMQLVQDYAPELLTGQQGGEGDESGVVRSLNAQLQAQATELAELRNKITARERSEQEQTQTTLNRQIADFAKDKPHFEAVRRHMAALLESGAADSLETAYEQAIYAVPDIRQQILDDQRKADEAKRAEEAKKKAEEAKRLASLNVKSNRGANPAKKGSWEDTLREVGERVAG